MNAPSIARRRSRQALAPTLVLLLGLAGGGVAHESGGGHAGHAPAAKPAGAARAWEKLLAQKTSLAVGLAFDDRGRLWRARVADGHVELQRSDDRGAGFGPAVRVNARPQHVAAHGDDRPKLAFTGDGGVLVAWTENLADTPFASHVWLARSDDGGRTFGEPLRLNGDGRAIGHGFAELVAAGDRVWAAWLDRRDGADARARGAGYKGAAIYVATSTDGGRSFGGERKLADQVCECCRMASAGGGDVPLLLWRHIYDGGIRDHALARLDAAAPARATHDEWKSDACPHHGPALARADGRVHLAWFSGSELRYRHGDGREFAPPLRLGDPDNKPSNPQVWAAGQRVVLAWKEFDGRDSLLRTMRSADAGSSWSEPRTVARSGDRSDHPLLLGDAGGVLLAWNTVDGLRLIELDR